MNIEHFAMNVSEPVELTAWYIEHLGLQLVRKVPGNNHTVFLADSAGNTVIELYSNPKGDYPDYAAMSKFTFHIAFAVDDIEAETARLIAAGATLESEAVETASGDRLGFVRDPWGIALQLAERKVPLLD